jgi:pimeloyl-ACP methyl ester carboxylesterase
MRKNIERKPEMPEKSSEIQNLSQTAARLVRGLRCQHRRNAFKVCGVVAASTIIAVTAGLSPSANAQSFQNLVVPNSPLVLQSTGSFYVGGRTVSMSAAETGVYGADGGGPLAVDQMYVEYMIPEVHPKLPVVMVHGAALSGKSYETTPDGRMGWYEYFVRKGFPSYVVDQVARARSGFNQAPFNDVRAGLAAPSSQPLMRGVASDITWTRFRIGPVAGVKFDDSQFPVEAAGELAKQAVPDLSLSLPPNDPNYSALSELAKDLKGAVLMGHSQAARYPFETALLDPQGIKALIAIEPVGCKSNEYSPEQIAKLAKFPILVVFGDHLDMHESLGPSWASLFNDCQAFVARINAARGNATMLHTVELGIHGNGHMMMQDRNNIQIANLIMKWIDQHSQ